MESSHLRKILADTLKKTERLQFVALNEPREIYLNAIGESFDLWSSQSKKRLGKIGFETNDEISIKLKQVIS